MTTLTGVISYPIPAYSNVPINANYYQPSVFVISGITLGSTTIVTSASNLNYVIGQQVRLVIPPTSLPRELNQQVGYVISLPTATSVEITINSNKLNAFSAGTGLEAPQIIAIGDINQGAINNSGNQNTSTLVPGSFQNISPL